MTSTYLQFLPVEVPGEILAVTQGDTVRVALTFNYALDAPESVGIVLEGFIATKQGASWTKPVASGSTTVTLAPASSPTPVEAILDIVTTSRSTAGIYGLFIRFKDYPDAKVEVDNCIQIAEAPGLIASIMNIVMMVMMMSMIMPMMTSMGED